MMIAIDMFHYRRTIRLQMLADRGCYPHPWTRCDLCDKSTRESYLDQHEIIARSKTVKGSEARTASYDKHLCALLCRDCHEKVTRDGNMKLLDKNIERYGYDAVKQAWDAVGVTPFAFPTKPKKSNMNRFARTINTQPEDDDYDDDDEIYDNDRYIPIIAEPPTQERVEEVARRLWTILSQQDNMTYRDILLATGFTRTEIDAALIHIVMVFIATRGAKQIG